MSTNAIILESHASISHCISFYPLFVFQHFDFFCSLYSSVVYIDCHFQCGIGAHDHHPSTRRSARRHLHQCRKLKTHPSFPSIFSLDSLPLTCLHMQRRGDEVYRAAFASSCSRRKNRSNIFFSFYLFPFSVTDRPTTTFQVRLDPSLLSESFVHFDGQIRSQSSVTQSNMFIPFLLNTIKLYV